MAKRSNTDSENNKRQKIKSASEEMDKLKERVEEMQNQWAVNKINDIVTELEKTDNDSHPKPYELVVNSYSEQQLTILKQCIEYLGLGLKIECESTFYHGADPIVWKINRF